MSNAALALHLAGCGLFVFPCSHKSKRPVILSAHPEGDPLRGTCQGECGKEGHGYHDATTDPAKINEWWDTYTNALVGVWCKRSGIFALDVDRKDGLNGWKTLQRLAQARTGEKFTPPTARQKTPSGGYHFLYSYPDGLHVPNNASKLGEGLDLRSDGYICTGTGYLWPKGVDLGSVEIGPAPAWLLDEIKKMTAPGPRPERPTHASLTLDSGEFERGWYEAMIAKAHPGNRNEVLYNLGLQFRWGGVPPDNALGWAVKFAAETGLPESEAIRTMKSAYNTPMRDPAPPPGRFRPNNSLTMGVQKSPEKSPDVGGNEPPVRVKNLQPDSGMNGSAPASQTKNKPDKAPAPTQPDLADRWLETAPETVYGRQEWRRYEGGAWPAVPEDVIKAEVASLVRAAQVEGLKPNATTITGAMEFARLSVLVPDSKWDSDPDRLPCQNGALHIPTMTLQPHDPANLFTFRVGYDYDPSARAETWQYFLETTLEEDAALFLQEFAGYSLTTDTKHEVAVWLYGKRGSGKSTFIEGLRAMLGDRAGILGLARIEQSRFALGAIVGKTLLTATEQPAVFMQQSHLLNSLISGEPIVVERKFKDEFEITPVAKILWAMNEFPRLGDPGNGIFRRVKVVQFPDRPEGQRDERIKEAIKNEGSGILNWALEGLNRLRKNGRFTIPEQVRKASEEFEKANNVPRQFVEECCRLNPSHRTQASQLYTAYKEWCLENGHKPQSSTSLAQDWKNMGLENRPINGRVYWFGIGLLKDL